MKKFQKWHPFPRNFFTFYLSHRKKRVRNVFWYSPKTQLYGFGKFWFFCPIDNIVHFHPKSNLEWNEHNNWFGYHFITTSNHITKVILFIEFINLDRINDLSRNKLMLKVFLFKTLLWDLWILSRIGENINIVLTKSKHKIYMAVQLWTFLVLMKASLCL